MNLQTERTVLEKLDTAATALDRAKIQRTCITDVTDDALRHDLLDHCAYASSYVLVILTNAMFAHFGKKQPGDMRMLRDQLAEIDEILDSRGLPRLTIRGLVTIDAGLGHVEDKCNEFEVDEVELDLFIDCLETIHLRFKEMAL